VRNELLYGRRPVYESLRARRRRFKRLILAQGVKDTEAIAQVIAQAAERQVPVERLPRQELETLTQGGNHQGMILEASAYPYTTPDGILALASKRGEPPFLLLLDLLQDVQNVGALLRAAEAVGVHGVILQERRAAEVTPAVVRASSGAVEHLLVARVTNLVQVMKTLQEAGVWLAGLDMAEDALRYDQADLGGSLGVVVGSEGQGLRRLVRETCDFVIRLPMRGQVESLNAATAGSVALYAVWAARGFA
jgi:23S rRNA (guanosine2251-2'-O)-methyltransferase